MTFSNRTWLTSQHDECGVVTLTSTNECARRLNRLARQSADYPYALIVLAQKEIEAHRIAQAERLIEAAFTIYDQFCIL
jgi:hypothetical protein